VTGTVGNMTVDHEGTVQGIFAQIAADHKDFAMPVDEIGQLDPDRTLSQELRYTYTSFALLTSCEHTDSESQSRFDCIPVAGQPWDKAQKQYIQDGIKYLNKVKGSCGAPVNKCVRVSCSWIAGIYLCNDVGLIQGMSCIVRHY
tara:strand:+ start:1495 stop:1926 length:432 start_codon:yes stop_codon:yes gene_type:complete